jgi:hypothetical protein
MGMVGSLVGFQVSPQHASDSKISVSMHRQLCVTQPSHHVPGR